MTDFLERPQTSGFWAERVRRQIGARRPQDVRYTQIEKVEGHGWLLWAKVEGLPYAHRIGRFGTHSSAIDAADALMDAGEIEEGQV